MFHQIDTNLWELERPVKVPGLRMNHRMTVVKLSSGMLWIHSPVGFEDSIAQRLAALGPVAHFVAPNRYHDLHWPEWFARYPEATFYCAPGVREDHPNLPFQHVLSPTGSHAWETELPKLLIDGMPKLNEFVFLHAASRTLLVADLVFNLDVDQQHVLGKFFLKLNGIYGRAGCSRIFRRLIKDHLAFRIVHRRTAALQFRSGCSWSWQNYRQRRPGGALASFCLAGSRVTFIVRTRSDGMWAPDRAGREGQQLFGAFRPAAAARVSVRARMMAVHLQITLV